jgi:hypothetical protein
MRAPVYTTVAALDAFIGVENYLPSKEAKEKAILQAQSDIDLWVGRSRGYDATTGLVYDPTDKGVFDEFMVEDLSEATCAQVKYRLTMGESFFMESPRATTVGPDYNMENVPKISPETIQMLRRHGIIPRYARGRA